MFTFTELHLLCTQSYFLKYIGYLLPFFFYFFVNFIWNRYKSSHVKNQSSTTNIDVVKNTDTDSKNVDDDADDGSFRPHLPERDHIPYKGITEWLDKSGEQFYKIANVRRSIRKFAKNKPVDFEVIRKCILTAGIVS